eukprot:6210453-Pleurochrysis_carterae.AAC.2
MVSKQVFMGASRGELRVRDTSGYTSAANAAGMLWHVRKNNGRGKAEFGGLHDSSSLYVSEIAQLLPGTAAQHLRNSTAREPIVC